MKEKEGRRKTFTELRVIMDLFSIKLTSQAIPDTNRIVNNENFVLAHNHIYSFGGKLKDN